MDVADVRAQIGPYSTPRAAKVNQIISLRQPHAIAIQKRIDRLRTVRDGVSGLAALRDQVVKLLERGREDEQRVATQLRQLPLPPLADIDQQIDKLYRVLARFSRQTINVGVVGFAREGKSETLKSLSGVDDNAIPTSNKGHCTAVKSLIFHEPNVDTRAEVWFYTEEEFLEKVIWPYYQQFNLGRKPGTVDAFASSKLAAQFGEGQSAERTRFDALRKYQQDLAEYRHWFSEPSPKIVFGNAIREYVAHNMPKGLLGREKPLYAHNAVREVKITCSFPNSDVGRVVLIDLPGLGAQRINDRDLLQRTLGEQADFVLFIKMPRPTGEVISDEDNKLFDLAWNATPDLPLSLWSVYILNRVRGEGSVGDNFEQCEHCLPLVSRMEIQVLKTEVVDCKNPTEVGKIFDWVLNYLCDNLADLDQQYAANTIKDLETQERSWAECLQKALAVFGRGVTGAEGAEIAAFERFFEVLWGNLLRSFGVLREKMHSRISQPDAMMSRAVERVTKSSDDAGLMPTDQEITDQIYRDKEPPRAFYTFLDRLRTGLSNSFLDLDIEFEAFLESIKEEVTDILLHQGRLSGLFASKGSALLHELGGEMLSQGQQPEDTVVHGVKIFADAQLSYRGFIQHRVRMSLDRLTQTGVLKHDAPPTSFEDLKFQLQKHFDLAVGDVANAVAGWLQEPNQVAFTLVEELVDRVMYAPGARLQWHDFYACLRWRLWRDEFSALNEQSDLRAKWRDSVENVLRSLSLVDPRGGGAGQRV